MGVRLATRIRFFLICSPLLEAWTRYETSANKTDSMYASTRRGRPPRPALISPYARQRTEKSFSDGHNSFVQILANKPALRPWIMTTGTTLAIAAGFAALMAWMPLLLGTSRDTLPVSRIEDANPDAAIDAGTQPLIGLARSKVTCAECGLIESIGETEFTVRLQDGSSRVMIDANPGRLRVGERVKVIDGLAGPGT